MSSSSILAAQPSYDIPLLDARFDVQCQKQPLLNKAVKTLAKDLVVWCYKIVCLPW